MMEIPKILRGLATGDVRQLLGAGFDLFDWLSQHWTSSGMYEVLEHDVCLELRNSKGTEAIYFKRQKVRFLQDNIIAYQDQAWGDGDIFADYKCSPGIPVDRYRDGHRYRILISLRQTKNRGDVEEFHIQRTIKDGFTQATEELQTEISHCTRKVSLSVIFPKPRPPRLVQLIEQQQQRTTNLYNTLRTLPDGRMQASWTTDHPKRYEAYSLRWEW